MVIDSQDGGSGRTTYGPGRAPTVRAVGEQHDRRGGELRRGELEPGVMAIRCSAPLVRWSCALVEDDRIARSY